MSGRQDRNETGQQTAIGSASGRNSRSDPNRAGTLIEAVLPPVLAEFELVLVSCEESAEPQREA